jgi:hypothetical protein
MGNDSKALVSGGGGAYDRAPFVAMLGAPGRAWQMAVPASATPLTLNPKPYIPNPKP